MSHQGTYRIEDCTDENPETGASLPRQKILYFTPTGEFELEEEFYGEIRPGYIPEPEAVP